MTVSGDAAFALRHHPELAQRLAQFLFLDNLLVFTLGVHSRRGFTEGSTLLQLRGQE